MQQKFKSKKHLQQQEDNYPLSSKMAYGVLSALLPASYIQPT